jgi:hypothetical protein
MLAYTAIDGLRAISRDFDLNWQPDIDDRLATSGREWRTSLGVGRQVLTAIALLLPFGAAAWLR